MLIFFCRLFLYASSPAFAQLVADPRLVEPYSYELEDGAHLEKPFLARHERDRYRLYYLASKHAASRSSKTFNLIKRTFEKNSFEVAVIEGYPRSDGFNPKSYADYAKRKCAAADFCEGGEPAYTALLSVTKGIQFVGGEPDEADLLARVVKEGYTPEDFVGFYFARQLPQLERERRLSIDNLQALFDEFMLARRQKLGAAFPDGFSLDRFKTWYSEKNGKPFSLPFDKEESSPRLDGKLFTQRVGGVVDVARNRFVVELLARLLNDHHDVLIVFGASHYFSQRKALETMLGKAKIAKLR